MFNATEFNSTAILHCQTGFKIRQSGPGPKPTTVTALSECIEFETWSLNGIVSCVGELNLHLIELKYRELNVVVFRN